MSTGRRRLGARGEEVARGYLEAKGYQIIETNFRCRWGEVDIIALDGAWLVFVEVRARRSPQRYGTPEESLSKGKRERLVATAEAYLQGCPATHEAWRIDLIAVHVESHGRIERMEHLEHAIQLN